jgi:hypothetical protein
VNRPPRLGRRGARRLLEGHPGTRPREQRLAEFLDALAERDKPGRKNTVRENTVRENTVRNAVPAPVLEAFARQAAEAAAARPRPVRSGSRSGAASGVRSRRVRRALTVKAAVVLVLSGATVAAAAADALPAPAQRAAHELLGSWGVPAPGVHRAGLPGRPGASMGPATPGGAPGASAGPGAGRYAHVPGAGSASSGADCASGDGGDGRTHRVPSEGNGNGNDDGDGATDGFGYGADGEGDAFGPTCADSPALPGAGSVDGGAASPSPTAAEPGVKSSEDRAPAYPDHGRTRTPRATDDDQNQQGGNGG